MTRRWLIAAAVCIGATSCASAAEPAVIHSGSTATTRGSTAATAPTQFSSRPDLAPCGEVDSRRHTEDDDVAFECFADAFSFGRPVELIEHHRGAEGGDMVSYLRVVGAGVGESYVHVIGDPMGQPGWSFNGQCTHLEYVVGEARLTACQGATALS